MKKLILTSLLASAVLVNMSAQWSGTNPLSTSNRVAITKGGVGPDNGYNGSLSITQPPVSGQYINLTRAGQYPWSIGTVYNGNNFAIGQGTSNDASFTNPYFVVAASTGNVGIGTTTPTAQLEIYKTDNPYLMVSSPMGKICLASATCDGCYANGAKTGDAVIKAVGNTQHILFNIANFANNGNAYVGFNDEVNGVWCKFKNNKVVSINGSVGIGTETPDAPLTVKGTIHATQVKIDLSGSLADYVFDKNYKLMDLKDVESYVNEHSHLPEVPSATEVANKGMDLGEMQNKMLQKIEELTLYVIKQQKEIEALKATSGK